MLTIFPLTSFPRPCFAPPCGSYYCFLEATCATEAIQQMYLATMRNVKLLVLLLACLIFTGEAAALALGASTLPLQGCGRGAEVDETTVTSDTFRLRNGTILQISPSTLQEVVYKQHKGRKLGGFRECSPCTCCDSTRRWCLPTVCCYQINCGVRDLPFGICSFTPISCSCLGCRD